MRFSQMRYGITTAVVVFTAISVVGCAHVKRDEMAAELQQVRSEINAGDAANASDIDQVEAALRSSMSEVEAEVAANRARIEALDREIAALEAEFGATVERMEGMIAFNVPVHFGFDSDVLRDEDKPVLDRFASVVQEYYAGSLVTVEGFTDPAGDPEYNLKLGQRRAEGVKGYLSEIAKMDADDIRSVSYGEAEDRQIRPGAWGDNGAANRRVTLVVDYSGGDRQ